VRQKNIPFHHFSQITLWGLSSVILGVIGGSLVLSISQFNIKEKN